MVPKDHVMIKQYLQKPCAKILQNMVGKYWFHLVLFHYNIYAISCFFLKHWHQNILKVPLAILIKAQSNLIVRIWAKRATADIHLQSMPEDLPNGVFIFDVLLLNHINNFQGNISFFDFLLQLCLRLPDKLEGWEVLPLGNFLQYLCAFFVSIF